MKTKYTRRELIHICKRGRVLYDDWSSDRDSHQAQSELMMAHLLLESGCKFKMSDSNLKTDDQTIWIKIFFDDWENGESWHTFYLPTPKRLKEANGKDWY